MDYASNTVNPTDSLAEIIDASRRPVKWLSLYSFADEFGINEARRCRSMKCCTVVAGQRYGVIDLSKSPVTDWEWWDCDVGAMRPCSTWAAVLASDVRLRTMVKLRLGDGTPEPHERKDELC